MPSADGRRRASFLPEAFIARALLQESAKRSNACPGADHDNRRCRIFWESKAMRRLHINGQIFAELDTFRKEGRGDAKTLAFADHVTNRIDR